METCTSKASESKSQLELGRQSASVRREGENGGSLLRLWKREEVQLIAAFFYHNEEKFRSQSEKKRQKVYKRMSVFIQTKNINQCRTYTKKLFTTFKTTQKINSFFRNILQNYEKVTDALADKNEKINQIMDLSSSEDEQQSNHSPTEERIKPKATIVHRDPYTCRSPLLQNEHKIMATLSQSETFERYLLCHSYFMAWLTSIYNFNLFLTFQQ